MSTATTAANRPEKNKDKTTDKRDAQATAEKILCAAQLAFHEHGFDAATTRDIAGRAGVDIALINRYFGSKLGLFEQAIIPWLSLERFLDLPLESLPEWMSNEYVSGKRYKEFDPFVVMLKSIGSAEAGPILVEALRRQAVEPLMKKLGNNADDAAEARNAEARAIMVTSQLSGLILHFRVVQLDHGSEVLTEMKQLLRTHLEQLMLP